MLVKNKFKFFNCNSMIFKSLFLRKNLVIRDLSLPILSNFLHKKVKVYDGKSFFNLEIKESMLGFKFGEFVFTKKRAIFTKKK